MKEIVVVKVGTSTVVSQTNRGESFDVESFSRIGGEIETLQQDGYGVILVSSAAITGGMVRTGTHTRPARKTNMPELQRLASIGWRTVLNAWDEATPRMVVGELLLTRAALSLDHERDEALRVIHTLLKHGDLPVINENDAVAHEEIAFGDNDTLAAIIAAKIAQSPLFEMPVSLVILSDIEGVYEDHHDPATCIPVIDAIEKWQHVIGDSDTSYGTGGMLTKFRAAEIATAVGVTTHIVHGRTQDAIHAALGRSRGTCFLPKKQ